MGPRGGNKEGLTPADPNFWRGSVFLFLFFFYTNRPLIENCWLTITGGQKWIRWATGGNGRAKWGELCNFSRIHTQHQHRSTNILDGYIYTSQSYIYTILVSLIWWWADSLAPRHLSYVLPLHVLHVKRTAHTIFGCETSSLYHTEMRIWSWLGEARAGLFNKYQGAVDTRGAFDPSF
jgi:hypothetical protein